MDEGIAAELVAALEPVLRDLAATGLQLVVTPDDWGEVMQRTAMCRWPDGSGTGVWVLVEETLAEGVARVADQVQDLVVESLPARGLPAVWPECPDHPDRHPLQARCVDGAAVWVCPREGRVVARIGGLAAPNA